MGRFSQSKVHYLHALVDSNQSIQTKQKISEFSSTVLSVAFYCQYAATCLQCFDAIGFTILVPAQPGSSGQMAVKWMCLCVCTVANRSFCVVITIKVKTTSHALTV